MQFSKHLLCHAYLDLIKKFNPDVDGYSIKTGTRSSPNSGLNVAVSGAVAKYVTSRTT